MCEPIEHRRLLMTYGGVGTNEEAEEMYTTGSFFVKAKNKDFHSYSWVFMPTKNIRWHVIEEGDASTFAMSPHAPCDQVGQIALSNH